MPRRCGLNDEQQVEMHMRTSSKLEATENVH